MKKIINLSFFLLACHFLNAQENPAPAGNPPTKMYVQAGAGPVTGNGVQGEIGLQAVFNNKWVATASYYGYSVKAKNTPANYKPAEGYVLFIPYTDDQSKIKMNVFQFTAGRIFPAGRSCWLSAEAGIAFVNGETATFKHNPDSDTFFYIIGGEIPSNYVVIKETKTSLGGVIKTDLNWAFCSFMGAGVGINANFNSNQSPVGFEAKLIIGKMGRAKK